MMMRVLQYLPVLAVAIGCLSFPHALEASVQVRYDILDYYDFIRPDGSQGDPLDKGFAVSGNIIVEVPSVPPLDKPLFTEDDDIFVAWNITLEVRNDSEPNQIFRLTQDNSEWIQDNDGIIAGSPFLRVDQNFVSLVDNQQFSDPDFGSNTLTLNSASLNTGITWFMPYGGKSLFTAGPVNPPDAPVYGVYEGGGGDFEIATFNSVVPEPSTIAIWSLLGLVGFGFAWRKRKA